MTLSANDLDAITQLYEKSTWTELDLQVGETRLYLGRRERGDGGFLAVSRTAVEPIVPAPPITQGAKQLPSAEPVGLASGGTRSAEAVDVPEGCVAVRAPSLGSFYRAAKPGAAPYVEVGQRVDAQTEVCLIEVMKLFTTVQAGVAGVVQAVPAKDGEMVEFGQVLFVINTRG